MEFNPKDIKINYEINVPQTFLFYEKLKFGFETIEKITEIRRKINEKE
jgi:hypothetical protein